VGIGSPVVLFSDVQRKREILVTGFWRSEMVKQYFFHAGHFAFGILLIGAELNIFSRMDEGDIVFLNSRNMAS
jgi:hypothetical protein